MIKNNIQLVEAALNIYQKYKTRYKLGTYLNAYSGEFLLTDCLGLIEGLMWGYPENGVYRNNNIPDLNCNYCFNKAKEKGSIDTIPEIPGLLLYLYGNPGHTGIYLGKGYVLEATAHIFLSGEGNGLVISQFKDTTKPNYRSNWTHWMKYPFIEYKEEIMQFKEGYQLLTWKNQKIHVYKSNKNEKISLYAMPPGELLSIDKLKIDGKKIKCVTNASYFDMVGGTNNILGRYQGLNCDNTTIGKGEKNYVGWKNTEDKPYTDLVITKDGDVKYGDFNSWDYRGDDVILGIAPAGVQLHDGKSENWYSPACTYSKITNANTQTLLLQCNDGQFALAVVEGKLSPLECRNFSIAYNCVHQSCYDSGDSSQMVVKGEKIVYTKRKLPDFFLIYEDEKNEAVEENTNEKEKIIMHVDSVGVRIREDLTFNKGKASGRILKTLKIGEIAEVLEFIDGIQADDYQWFKVSVDGVEGYAQYDSQCYWLEKK